MENESGKFYRIFDSRIATLVAVAGVFISILSFINKPAVALNERLSKLESQFTTEQQLSKQLQNIKDNDLHTLEGKVEDLRRNNEMIREQLTRLETILNERLPAKK